MQGRRLVRERQRSSRRQRSARTLSSESRYPSSSAVIVRQSYYGEETPGVECNACSTLVMGFPFHDTWMSSFFFGDSAYYSQVFEYEMLEQLTVEVYSSCVFIVQRAEMSEINSIEHESCTGVVIPW